MTRWVARLLAANVVMFALGAAMPEIPALLAFRPRYFLQQPWTAFTYMFLHAGP